MVSGATRNVLDIEVVLRDLHGKNIVCEATNGVGSMQQKQTLNVECRFHTLQSVCVSICVCVYEGVCVRVRVCVSVSVCMCCI